MRKFKLIQTYPNSPELGTVMVEMPSPIEDKKAYGELLKKHQQ